MPNSEVPRIELNTDGTINLEVTVSGFDAGTPIEISGSVSQENGAVATFYSVQQMPQSGPVHVVRVSAVPPNHFATGFPITVVARAAQVWITALEAETGSGALQSRVVSEPLQAAWNVNSANWAVTWPGQNSPAPWPSQSAQQSWPATSLIHHGTWWDRVKGDALEEVMGGRFTRLFPDLPGARFDHAELEQLARAMTTPPEEPGVETEDGPEGNRTIPAVYTYLGQFADHDLTFDPASWAIDWRFFIDLDHGAGPVAGNPGPGPVVREPQLSFKIDTSLANPLGDLPARIARDPSSLALRNLERGAIFQLPSGQSVARALGMPVIADNELVIGKATADSLLRPITEVAPGFAGNGRLVAEVTSLTAEGSGWPS